MQNTSLHAPAPSSLAGAPEASAALPAISLAVYCGSRMGTRPEYKAAAVAVGHWIGERGGQLVYGGGNNGLMGVVAHAALDAGAYVIGVIPEALVGLEQANTRCSELLIVNTMHERKAHMANRANAFIAMPGGIGTLEEIIEMWVWRQLGYHNKPLGFLNLHGYYDALLNNLQQWVGEGFMNPSQMDLIKRSSDVSDLLRQIYPLSQ